MNKKPRRKKCKTCRETFQPERQFQEACTIKCAIGLAAIKRRKKEAKEWLERKRNLKPISHWLAKTQKVFNEYIRLRDRQEGCISCSSIDSPEWCAGHYRTRGAASHLRFNEDNVHKQCNKNCNLSLSGNVGEYRPRLIAKIGLKRVEVLENDNAAKDWEREELEEIRKYYRGRIKEIEEQTA